MPKMITVLYKCSCMKDEAPFDMPARRFNEDVMEFIGRVAKWVGDDHSQRSPFCRATKTEYVKIPVAGDAPIGASKEHLN